MSGKNTTAFETLAERLADAGLDLHLVAVRSDVRPGDGLEWAPIDPDGPLDLRSQTERLQAFADSSEFSRIVEIEYAARILLEQNSAHSDEVNSRFRELAKNRARLAELDEERLSLIRGARRRDEETEQTEEQTEAFVTHERVQEAIDALDFKFDREG